MPKCDLCGIDEDQLYKCKECGRKFCEWCGDVNEKMCIDCLDALEDEDWDDEDDDEEE